jgi:hypothetical protein
MLRRLLSATALVACTGVYAFAAPERADFILTNGDRQSGTVVSSGSRYQNNGELTLATNRRDVTFRLDEIAVIEFAGGEPAPGELNRLGPDQTLVMRDGRILGGRFVSLVGGDTIVWDSGRGRPEQVPIRTVNRVYLNPDRARWVYNDRGRFYGRDGTRDSAGRDYQGRDQWGRGEYGREYGDPRDGRAVGTTGQRSGREIQVRVEANQPWIDTGIVVNEGDRVTFHASGQIAFGRSRGQTSNPDGNPSEHRATYPDPRVPVGALIGRVGNSAAFGIGMQTQPLPMPASGRLFLGVNDDDRSDNSGFYLVTVSRQ